MAEPLILGIETSGILCSIAWWQSNEVLLEYNVERKNAHAIVLAHLIDEGLQKLYKNPEDITCVAVSSGPGSFTGLRIGMAYAKGFCYGADIPLISVSNFEVLAHTSNQNCLPIYTLIDARKQNYYTGVFTKDITQLEQQLLLNISQLETTIPENAHIIVHEEQQKGLFKKTFKGKGSIVQGDYNAVKTCSIARQKYLRGDFIDIDQIEPMYLQAFAGVL